MVAPPSPAFVNETTFDAATIYDGCTLTTGLPHTPGRTQKPIIRPNPTPGRFTVEFQDPLMKDSYYSVYDVMGKLLFQRAAAQRQGNTEEVVCAGYSTGHLRDPVHVIKARHPAAAREWC